jgi:glycosyltransferase involved in cell wall biosynthesis
VAAPLGEPLISIVFAAHEAPAAHVAATVATLRAQTYERWELCLAASDSTSEATRAALADAEAASARIFIADRLAAPASEAIVAAHRLASGAYLAFPGEFKRFAPDALRRCVDFLRATPEADVLFADSGLIDVGRFALIRRDFVTELGGPRAALVASHAGDVVAHLAGRSERVYSL